MLEPYPPRLCNLFRGRTDFKELALEITTDADHKFELALQLDDLDTAVDIARTVPEQEAEIKWRSVGDRALAVARFDLAKESFAKAGDLNSLMLIYYASADRKGLAELLMASTDPLTS